jgi:nitrogen fixation protein FixH
MPATAASAAPEQVVSCVQKSQAATQLIEAANARIEDARQDNSALAMRAAIADLQVALAQMKAQLVDCVSLATANTTAAQNAKLAITFKSLPSPARIGENTFEVTVKGPDGKPVTDADVSVLFRMPAMPAMRMPEMQNTVALKSQANGIYRGTGQVMMGGQWELTVIVTRNGKEIGSEKLKMTAR